MSFITFDRTQRNLLGYSIDDFAKADAKGRFVVETVSHLKLDSLFTRYSEQGADSFAPDMMLALWFYSYSNGITSTRELEELCHYDTRYIYISANLKPDHTTLSRFRQAHLDLLSEYFVQIVLLAQEGGITDLKHISIDGTKIKASASPKHGYKEDHLKRKIEAVRRDIKHYMAACDRAEQGLIETLDLESLQKEKKRLEALETKLLKSQKRLKERKKTIKPEYREKHQVNTTDPDARYMAKPNTPAYNGQLAVDDGHNFIVANDVNDAPNDQNEFAAMHQKTEENLPKDKDRHYTADSGYHSLEQLEYIEENKIDALIADRKPEIRSINSQTDSMESFLKENKKLQRKDFIYHSQHDYYECPAGEKLPRFGVKKNIVVYQAGNCSQCPLASLCVKKSGANRHITRDIREPLAEQMARKLATNQAKERMKTRAITVEPVFGNLKQNLGFDCFSLRGLIQVKGEFNLMCIAHNLNILFKYMQSKPITGAMAALNHAFTKHIAISKNRVAIFFYKMTRFSIFQFRLKYGTIQP